MLGKVGHSGTWEGNVSITAMHSANEEEEGGGMKADGPSQSNGMSAVHDYIGLSLKPLPLAAQNAQLVSTGHYLSDVKEVELECGDTELRLGIGRVYNGDTSLASRGAHASMPHQRLPLATRQLADALGCPCGDLFVKTSMDVEQSFWPWIAPGMFRIPVPKVSTASAKRPYVEIGSGVGENKEFTSDFSTASSTQPEVTSNFAIGRQLSMVPSLQGLYTWSHNSTAINWQSSSHEAVVPASANRYSLANGSLLPPPASKPPGPSLPTNCYNLRPPSTSGSTSDGRASLPCRNGQEDARMSKAPVVGWPPVRSFRKNTLHSTSSPAANKMSTAPSHVQKHVDATIKPCEAGGEQNKVSNKDTLFVKVKLDGVRICRKADLTSYNSYDSLKSALQEMFQGFISNDSAKLDLLQGKHYVLTHEDKDGDWMLVGDVPWNMFVTTVKSLRIMRAVDAVGLGQKVFAKVA